MKKSFLLGVVAGAVGTGYMLKKSKRLILLTKCPKRQAVFRLRILKNKMQKDLDYYRKEYAKQKKLEYIVKSRILIRPNVKKWQVIMAFSLLPFLFISLIFLPILTNYSLGVKAVLSIILILIIIECYLRFCLIITVKCYQNYAKDDTRKRCKCIPSCSEYAVLTLRKIFPLLIALLKIRKRLFKTCNGEEYKIDFPTKKMEKDFENQL